MKRSFIQSLAALALGAGVGLPAAALPTDVQFRVRDLSVLTGLEDATVYSINNRGDFTLLDRASGHNYLWRDGTLHDLGRHGYGTVALNERGDVVGTRLGADGVERPFLWRDGRFTDLADALGARSGRATAINESGQITGPADGRAFIHDGTRGHFIDVPGAVSSTGADINDRGLVVGTAVLKDDALDERGFASRDGARATWLPEPIAFDYGGEYEGVAVNNRGNAIVGYYDYNWGELGTVLYLNGERIDLGWGSYPVDLNERDWAAGTDQWESNQGEYDNTAMLYRAQSSRALNNLLTSASAARWDLKDANALNDRGQIVGMGLLRDGRAHMFLATPVPEPGSVAMLLLGGGVLGALARRRRR